MPAPPFPSASHSGYVEQAAAARHIQRAIGLDPLNPGIHTNAGLLAGTLGRLELAHEPGEAGQLQARPPVPTRAGSVGRVMLATAHQTI